MGILKFSLIIFLAVILNKDVISQELHPGLTDPRNISPELKHQGNIVKAFLWNENLSENYILYCETDEYNSQCDIAPTISEILDIKKPDKSVGKSLMKKIIK